MSGDNEEDFVLPAREIIAAARARLISSLPANGLGEDVVRQHLATDVGPALNRASKSPHYYGFVTGGSTPLASFADNLVTEYDQNVHVHLPDETITTDVEDRALQMVAELIDADEIGREGSKWTHRIFTTGATGSNIAGLTLGRDYVLQEAARRRGVILAIAECGMIEAVKQSGVDRIQILSTVAHSSLKKAASIVGLGRACVVDVGDKNTPHVIDAGRLEEALREPGTASIIAVSCSEVNTGLFATNGAIMEKIRSLADTYGAWVHVDAAFGLTAALLPDTQEFRLLRDGVQGLALADSITGDGHKMLNVPYDCGIFLSRHLDQAMDTFGNPNAAYLKTPSSGISTTTTPSSQHRTITSPLNIGLENSRRFRALPVYATLAAYGRDGYRDMIVRQVRLARAVATFIAQHPEYELLPEQRTALANPNSVTPTPNTSGPPVLQNQLQSIYMVVLFRARDQHLNQDLTKRINATRKIYVSGTQWADRPATRFAIANWQVHVDRDLHLITEILNQVLVSDN